MLIKIGLIEDNLVLLRNYYEFFSAEHTFKVIFSLSSVQEINQLDSQYPPDIILLDLMLPSGNSLDLIHVIKQTFPESRIIILSSVSDPNISRSAIAKGATGFLLKSSSLEFIKDALHKAFEGAIPLSPSIVNHLLEIKQGSVSLKEAYPSLTKREIELIFLLKTGMANKVAASVLNISFFTVNHHSKNIYRKLNIHSKAELISIASNFASGAVF